MGCQIGRDGRKSKKSKFIMAKQDIRKTVKTKMRAMHISVPVLARRVNCNPLTLYNFFQGNSQLGADLLQDVFNELKIKIG